MLLREPDAQGRFNQVAGSTFGDRAGDFKHVLVVESGTTAFEKEIQDLYDGKLLGHSQLDLRTDRLCLLGLGISPDSHRPGVAPAFQKARTKSWWPDGINSLGSTLNCPKLGSRSIEPGNPVRSAMFDNESGRAVWANVHSHSSPKIPPFRGLEGMCFG
jgi:hypothetical protein